MKPPRESDRAKIRRLERDLRVYEERERDFEERYQGPADIEGIGGRPGVIILRDKNMGEVRRVVDDLPNIPGLRSCCTDHHARGPHDLALPPLGFRRAVGYVRSEVAKMVDSVIVIGSYNAVLVRDRHRLRMWINNRAGMLLRPDVIGEEVRASLIALVEQVAFAPSVPHLFGMSQETEIQPVEAERKGYG